MAQTFEAIGYPMERVCYVLNRAGAPGSIDPRVVVEQIGRIPDFTLPSDGRLVVDANNQGVPFVLVEPRAPASVGRHAHRHRADHAPDAHGGRGRGPVTGHRRDR